MIATTIKIMAPVATTIPTVRPVELLAALPTASMTERRIINKCKTTIMLKTCKWGVTYFFLNVAMRLTHS